MTRKIYAFMGLSLLIVFAAGVYAQSSDRGRSYYDLGVFAYEDGDYEAAEKHLKKALELNPGEPLYHHFLGKIHLKAARYDEAMTQLNLAQEKDPALSGLKNDLALANYRMKNYSASARLFEEIAAEDPENVLAHYHAGISLYKEGQYQRALDRFTIASDKSPTIKANGYYYAGICHLKLGDLDAATRKLEFARDHGDTESLRQNARKFLTVINKRKKALKPYRVYAKLGYRYDSNVRLEPDTEDRFADEDDWVLVGYFSGRYNLIQKKPYTAGVGYRHYQTWYDTLDEYDLTGSIFSIYGKYDKGPFGLSLSYLPHLYWLDSDRYIRKHQLKAGLTCNIVKNLVARLSFDHFRNDHIQDSSWSGHSNEYALKAYYHLKDVGYLYGGVDFENRTTNDLDNDYGELDLSAGISLNVPWKIRLRLTGKYSDRDHDYEDSGYRFKRKDTKYNGAASVSRELFYDWLGVICEFDYTKRDSNIDSYDYTRKRTTLSLTARF